MSKVEWGEYKIEKLFKIQKVHNKLSKNNLSDKFNYPVYSSESNNNGIIGYTNEPEFICDSNTPVYITFGDHTRTMNIARKSFSVLDNVKVLLPCINNDKILLFIISVWKKQIPNIGYQRHWKVAQNCILRLPIKNGKIDFDFMESFIAELEAERIAELEAERIAELSAYLTVSGFNNYELSEKEEKAIYEYNNVTFKEYDLTEIFDVKNTSNILSRDIVPNSGITPYLCASAENNSVNSYISYNTDFIEKGDCIFIGGKTFVVSYQENDFYSNDSHNLALYLKNTHKTKANHLYLATCIYKSLKHKYSWGDSISKTKIKSDKINLPIKNGQLDFECMETLISAVQKLVIKDVALYTDKKVEATKNVVNNKK